MDQNISQFLDDIQSSSIQRFDTVQAIRELFKNVTPLLEEGFKYGGIVYSFSGGLIGGVFAYKEHLSIEFSYGADFLDPHGVLEGGGKKRRHIKIRDLKDVEGKSVSFYISEAMKNLPL